MLNNLFFVFFCTQLQVTYKCSTLPEIRFCCYLFLFLLLPETIKLNNYDNQESLFNVQEKVFLIWNLLLIVSLIFTLIQYNFFHLFYHLFKKSEEFLNTIEKPCIYLDLFHYFKLKPKIKIVTIKRNVR